MYECFVCLYVYVSCTHLVFVDIRGRALEPLELELLMVVSCHVGVVN